MGDVFSPNRLYCGNAWCLYAICEMYLKHVVTIEGSAKHTGHILYLMALKHLRHANFQELSEPNEGRGGGWNFIIRNVQLH